MYDKFLTYRDIELDYRIRDAKICVKNWDILKLQVKAIIW